MEHFKLTKLLHTDILEEKYWKIHTDIHIHDDTHRIVDLCDEKGISRTRAITIFLKESRNDEIYSIDTIIKSWWLIGKTFRDFGYEVRKNVVSVYVVKLSDDLKKSFGIIAMTGKIRLSEFYAKSKTSQPILYWIVAEIYSPDFRSWAVNQIDFSQINPLTSTFESFWWTKKDLWDILWSENDWSNTNFNHDALKSTSQYEVILYQERIAKYL